MEYALHTPSDLMAEWIQKLQLILAWVVLQGFLGDMPYPD